MPTRTDIRVKFRGKLYLLIGDMKKGGAIATDDQYENFDTSFAHLMENGEILRFGVVIGKRSDLKVVK